MPGLPLTCPPQEPGIFNPFKISEPTSIQFSGGRTSGLLLHKCLEANNGLPDFAHVLFENTGKERPEALDFVQECSQRWNVPITWLEYDPEAEHKTRIVNHNSASRAGEPFEALIRNKPMLPNPVSRYCTIELKIRRSYSFMYKMKGYETWLAYLGLRADEPHRVARSKQQRERWDNEMPLATAGITKQDVAAFWKAQPFDLRLSNINGATPHGNCDLCFLKSLPTIKALIHEDPQSAQWWQDMEAIQKADKPDARYFRKDRPSYAQLRDAVERQQVFDFGDESSIDCFCTD